MMPRHNGYENGWDNSRPSPLHAAPQGSGAALRAFSPRIEVVGLSLWAGNAVNMTGTSPVVGAVGSKAGQGFYLQCHKAAALRTLA